MKNYREKHTFIGVDLHKATHTAVMLDCWEEKIAEITFENKPSEFDAFIRWAKKHTPKGMSPVFGLEDVGGYGRSLAIHLVERDQIVKDVNPALAYDRRKSNPIQRKNDSYDAKCVGEVLISKFNTLPDANPQDIYFTIAQVVNRRNAIVTAKTAVTNQLHGQLTYNYPSYKQFFAEIDGKGALAFWEAYPSPHSLKKTTADELDTFLRSIARTYKKGKGKIIMDMVKADGDTTREYQETRDFIIKSYVRDIRFKDAEIKQMDKQLKDLMSKLDYQLETMAGIDTVIASKLVAEIGDINRFKNANKLAMYAGIAPVSFSSGGKGKDSKCQTGNRTLHGVFYSLALQQIQICKGSQTKRNPKARDYYDKKIGEGKTHQQAIVYVMRKLVNIIFSMMKNKTAYVAPPVEALQPVA